MWLAFSLEFYFSLDLGWLGVYPRDLYGMIGVFTAPLVHGNLSHLISNSAPLLVLGVSLYTFYPTLADRVFYQGYFFTNLLVWIFGRSFYHIGASGLVYSLAAFLIFHGFFKRNFRSVIISIIVIVFYGGLVYGLFPYNNRVSWESHLMGVIVGWVNAYLLGKKKY
jgi:membrane associated rhomboid family serine protease